MAAKKDLAQRRQLRRLEARRDDLQEKAAKMKITLAETRAAIKTMKKTRTRRAPQ